MGEGDGCETLAICRSLAFINGETDGLFGAIDPATPLPTTLPLFATGLGALGLLGWRREAQARVSLLGAP